MESNKKICPTCNKSFVNLKEHITKKHTKHILNFETKSFTYNGIKLEHFGYNWSHKKIETQDIVFGGWLTHNPQKHNNHHQFEIQYNKETKEIITVFEILPSGKSIKHMIKNIIVEV